MGKEIATGERQGNCIHLLEEMILRSGARKRKNVLDIPIPSSKEGLGVVRSSPGMLARPADYDLIILDYLIKWSLVQCICSSETERDNACVDLLLIIPLFLLENWSLSKILLGNLYGEKKK